MSDHEEITSEVSVYTAEGHLEGMLDRDQRTAKCMRITDKEETMCHSGLHPCVVEETPRAGFQCSTRVSHQDLLGSRVTNSFPRSSRHSYVYKTLQRLQRVLFLGVYFLSLVSLQIALSAPTKLRMADSQDNEPYWINPCGPTKSSGESTDGDSTDSTTNLRHFLNTSKTTTRIARGTVRNFLEEYANDTYQKPILDALSIVQELPDFLPDQSDIPKRLFKPVNEEHLKELKVRASLPHLFEQFQKIAVGLEQVILDRKKYDGKFLNEFQSTQKRLKDVLCELSMTIDEGGIKKKANITRDHMADSYRLYKNQTQRDLRDFMVLSQYMNALEYLEEVLDYFINHDDSIRSG